MKKYFLFLFIFTINSFCHADVIHLDGTACYYPPAKLAKVGKVSVFVYGASWCAPCHLLENRFTEERLFPDSMVDYFFIEIANQKSKRNPSLQNFIVSDSINILPHILIYSPKVQLVGVMKKYNDEVFSAIVSTVQNAIDASRNIDFALVKTEVSEPENERNSSASDSVAEPIQKIEMQDPKKINGALMRLKAAWQMLTKGEYVSQGNKQPSLAEVRK